MLFKKTGLKKWIFLITAVLLSGILGISIVMLLNIGEGQNETAADKVITIWYPWADNSQYNELFKKTVQEVNKQYPDYRIDIEGTKYAMYSNKLMAAVASSSLPDIYFTWSGNYLKNIVDSGHALPVDHYLNRKESVKLDMSSVKNTTFRDSVYGLSYRKTLTVLLINKIIFQEYGFSDPQSVDDLLDIAEKCNENGMVPFSCSNDSTFSYSLYLEMLCLSYAGKPGSIKTINGNEDDIQQFGNAVDVFEKLCRMNALNNNNGGLRKEDADSQFYMGGAPMYLTTDDQIADVINRDSPLYGKVKAISPNMMDKGEILGGVTEAFSVNPETADPDITTGILVSILENFARHLYEKGYGIPTWNMDGVAHSNEPTYLDVLAIDKNADDYMPFWETYTTGYQRKKIIENMKQLYDQKISQEEFLHELTGSREE